MLTRSGRSYTFGAQPRRSLSVGAVPSPNPIPTIVDTSNNLSNNVLDVPFMDNGAVISNMSGDITDGEYYAITHTASPIVGLTVQAAPVLDSGAGDLTPVTYGLSIPPTSVVEMMTPTTSGRAVDEMRPGSPHSEIIHRSYAEVARLQAAAVSTPVYNSSKSFSDNNNSNSNSSVTPVQVPKTLTSPETPQKICGKYVDEDGFILSSPSKSPTPAGSSSRMTGSKFFKDWFEYSDNGLSGGEGDESRAESIPGSLDSTSVPTKTASRKSDKHYQEFMKNIMNEMPTQDRIRVKNRAAKVDPRHSRKLHSSHSSLLGTSGISQRKLVAEGIETNSTQRKSSSVISKRYTQMEKGKGREILPSVNVKTESSQIGPICRNSEQETQILADERLARQLETQENNNNIIYTDMQCLPTAGPSGISKPEFSNQKGNIRTSITQHQSSDYLSSSSHSSGAYSMPGIYQLRNTAPGTRYSSIFPAQNLRATSQMPPGGYLSEKFRKPPNISVLSDSSSSRSSRSSYSATKRKKYHEHVKRRISEANTVKVAAPKPYDGSANFENFERWTFDVSMWFDITNFPRKHRVKYMSTLLTGKASKFYFTHVAPNIKKFTVELLCRELFNYCFPPRFRQIMRDRFYESTQGKQNIRDYIRLLRSLAARVPEINDFAIVQQLVKSAAPYLQIKWAEGGFSADFNSLQEYEESGYRFEQAEEVRLFLERRLAKEQVQKSNGTHPRHSINRKDDYPRPIPSPKSQNRFKKDSRSSSGPPRPHSPNFKQYSSRENSRLRFRDRSHPNRPSTYSGRSRNPLSQQERDILRANNQCFTCKQTGHLSKDCPQRNSVKPPGIQASAATIVETARNLDSIDSIDILHANATHISPLMPLDTSLECFDAYLIAQSEWDRIAQSLTFFRPSVVSDLRNGSELQTRYVITPYDERNLQIVDLIYNFIYYLPHGIVSGPVELLSEVIEFEEEIRADIIPCLPVPYVEYFWIDGSSNQPLNIDVDPVNNPLRLTPQQLRIQEIYLLAEMRRKREQNIYSSHSNISGNSSQHSDMSIDPIDLSIMEDLISLDINESSGHEEVIPSHLSTGSPPRLMTVSDSSICNMNAEPNGDFPMC